MNIYDEIKLERERQKRKYSIAHDDIHTPMDWLVLIQSFILKAASNIWSLSSTRKTLIKIAALAVAAIEAADRADTKYRENN